MCRTPHRFLDMDTQSNPSVPSLAREREREREREEAREPKRGKKILPNQIH
jgi:hypothetical protein